MFAPLFVYSYLTASAVELKARPRNERGASFTEYVVLLAAIVGVVAAGVIVLGDNITNKLNSVTPF